MSSFASILEREMASQKKVASRRMEGGVDVRDAVMMARLQPPVRDLEAERRALKQRFRQQVLSAHPDRGGSSEAFVAAVRAYERDLAAL